MRALVVLGAVAAHWRRHPVELATLLAGLAMATALWSGVQALNAEARAAYARAAAMLGGENVAIIAAADGGRFPVADFVALRRAGWPVSPVLEGDVTQGATRLRVVGVEPLTLPAAARELVGAEGDRRADFLSPEGLTLAARGTPVVTGAPRAVEADLPPDTIVVDIAVAERLLGVTGQVSRLILPADAAGPLPAGLGRLELRRPEAADGLARMADSFHLNLSAFGLLSFLVGLLIVYGAVGLAFEQRKPMLRTLRACGVSARLLAATLLAELTVLALVAGAAGVAGGYLLAASLMPDVAASLRGLYGARVPGSLGFHPSWWAAGLGMSVAGAFAAGGASLLRAHSLPALALAQPEAWAAAQARTIRRQAGLAALAAVAALGGFALEGGLLGGFALLGGLLLSAALVLPALLGRLLGLGAASARGAFAAWVWADMRQQAGGLSLALMALLVALAVNVGVGTMVDSFRRTFVVWLDQRLAAEAYVTARDDAQAREIAAWLDARPEVVARLPILRVDARIEGWPAEVMGVADHATYRGAWPMLALDPGGWDRMAAGEAAFVSEQLARRAGIGLGDTTTLPTPSGPWRVEVAGVYADYGNPEGHVLAAAPAVAAHWPEAERRRFALRLDPAAAPALVADLRAAFGLDPAQATDQPAIRAASTRVFERTFAATAALNALTLGVAGVAMFTSLLTLSAARLGQLAPVWAIGVTRRRLAALEIAKTLALAALTALLALPLGLAVAWTLTAVVNVAAFGWRLPVMLLPWRWAALLATALVTALAAAALPAWRLRRATPAALLQSFSNDR